MGILMSAAMPVWRQTARREKEAELVFRGEQYARAIGLYQRRFAAAFPPSIDVLVEQKFLRRKYTDPMTEDGEFQVLYQASLAASAPGDGSAPSALSGARSQTGPSAPTRSIGPRGGVIGVVSKSEEASIRLYNDRITTTNGFSSTSPRRPRSVGRRVSSKAAPAAGNRETPVGTVRVGAEGRRPRRPWDSRSSRTAPRPAWGRRKTSRRSPEPGADTESG